jgi:fucose permease
LTFKFLLNQLAFVVDIVLCAYSRKYKSCPFFLFSFFIAGLGIAFLLQSGNSTQPIKKRELGKERFTGISISKNQFQRISSPT